MVGPLHEDYKMADVEPQREMTLQELIDEWGATRVQRLAEQKKVDRLEETEKKLKALVIAKMVKAKQTSTGAQKYGANYSKKNKPVAGDWSKIYAYIRENNEFDLLQKRLMESAIQARWDDKIEIPGIITFPVEDITMFTV
jgi:hypothetical protein